MEISAGRKSQGYKRFMYITWMKQMEGKKKKDKKVMQYKSTGNE